jgi:PKD repeat protein
MTSQCLTLSIITRRSTMFTTRKLIHYILSLIIISVVGLGQSSAAIQASDAPQAIESGNPQPLPTDCVGVGGGEDACCAYGYIYFNGAPVEGASVSIESAHGVISTTTLIDGVNENPYYATNLSDEPLSVVPGDVITITATYNGISSNRTWTVQEGAQHVDLGLLNPLSGWWSTNLQVNDDAGTSGQGYPAVAADGEGNLYAVWGDQRNGNWDIFFAGSTDGGQTWSVNKKVSDDPGSADQIQPVIAVNQGGSIYVIWDDKRNDDGDIYFAVSGDKGSTWSTNVRINDDVGARWQGSVDIVAGSGNDIYVIWSDARGGSYIQADIYFARSTDGGQTWSASVKVSDDSGTEFQGNPVIDRDETGTLYTAWTDRREGNDNYNVYFSFSTDDGDSWSPNTRVNEDPAGRWQSIPTLAASSTGTLYLAWEDQRNGVGDSDIYFTRSSDGGNTWSANLRANDDTGTAKQQEPEVGLDAVGNLILIWEDQRDGNWDIYTATSMDGGISWETNVRVNDDKGTTDQTKPAVVMDATGFTLVAWADGRNGNMDIYSAVQYSGAPSERNWQQVSSVTSPFPRYGHAMAYDSNRGRIVLFGGFNATGGIMSDTWEFDGATWIRMYPVRFPPARGWHAMTFDSQRGVVVLFGGYSGIGLSDTWEYDGITWVERTFSTYPGARWNHELVYDDERQVVVLFSGDRGGSLWSDTWEYNGAGWASITTIALPPPRTGYAMAYDASRDRVVLMGGYNDIGYPGHLTDLWEYDGTNWYERTFDFFPSERDDHVLVYSHSLGRVVLFGGHNNSAGSLSDTWEYDGGSWLQVNPLLSPPARHAHAAIYDTMRGYVVVFGGFSSSTGNLNDTWLYGSVAPHVPPMADFTASPLSGNVPLIVTFTDLSDGEVVSWDWTFGDGGVSGARHPAHEYQTVGTYDISLTVSNRGNSDTETKVNYITAKAFTPNSYSISGQVMSPESYPAPGITVSTNSGLSSITGTDGAYVFTGLETSTYTITPSLSGYLFSPPWRTVSVPPDAKWQDFIITAFKPIILTAESGYKNIQLTWNSTNDPSVIEFQVSRAINGTPVYTPIATTSNTTYFDGDNLIPNTEYCYKVDALRTNGEVVVTSNIACAVYGQLALWVPDTWASPGSTAIVPVNICNADGLQIAATDIWLDFDDSVIEVVGITNTALTEEYAWAYSITSTVDYSRARIAAITSPGQEPYLYGDGSLFWITFQVQGSAGMTSTINLREFIAGVGGSTIYSPDNLYDPVPLILQDGTFHIGGGEYTLGDLNGNGVVEAIDAYIALLIVSGQLTPTWEQKMAGDVNGNGVVDSADASMILYYAAHGSWPTVGGLTPKFLEIQPDAEVILGLDDMSGLPGAIVETVLRAEDLTNWAGGEMVIAYDAGLITEFISVEATGLASDFIVGYYDDGAGLLHIAIAKGAPVSGSGELLRIRLRIDPKALPGTLTSLTLSEAKLNDILGRDFATSALQTEVKLTNGQLKVLVGIYIPLIMK